MKKVFIGRIRKSHKTLEKNSTTTKPLSFTRTSHSVSNRSQRSKAHSFVRNEQNDQKPLNYYFNPETRKKFIKTTVDKYLPSYTISNIQTSQSENPESRISKTSHTFRRTKKNSRIKDFVEFIPLQMFLAESFYSQSLPIIKQSQEEITVRPFSERKIRGKQLINIKDHDLGLSIESSMTENNSFFRFSQKPQEQSLLFQCKYYRIFKINDKKERIKRFKVEGIQILEVEKRVKKLGMPVMWEFEPPKSFTYPIKKCLRSNFMSFVSFQQGSEQILKYFPSSQYEKLFSNRNQWLVDIIVEICKYLQKVEGRVINNKIDLENIYQEEEKKFIIEDWSCCGFKQVLKLNGQLPLVKYHKPILKDGKKWLCKPAYVSPQILKASENNFWKFQDLFHDRSSVYDIWGLGCLIFEILTVVPLDSGVRCSVKRRKTLRKGYLESKTLDCSEILAKQLKLSVHFQQIITKECENLKIDKTLQLVLKGMLQFDQKKRLTAGEVLNLFRKRKA